MGSSVILVIIVFIGMMIESSKSDILVYTQTTNTIIEEFPDAPARFGPNIPAMGFRCLAVAGVPEDGCSQMSPPPINKTIPFRWCVVVARYNCSFENKTRNAQAAHYDAIIVRNVGSDELEPMSANNDDGIVIPAIFVGEHSGRTIISDYLYNESFALMINNESPFNINTHLLIPFTIVVGLCFVTMIIFTVVRCCRERRRMMRHRLPKSVLKKIPTIKFASGVHHYDTCAICLDDYVDGEKLRVLPCTHAYHCKCIDPWLTKNRRVCPMCKRKVFVRGEKRPPRRRSSSDTSTASDVDDTTPLLTAIDNQPQADHGTFPQFEGASMSSGLEASTPWSSYPGGMSDDDEMLDAHTPNNETLTDSLTPWQRFKRICGRLRSRADMMPLLNDEEDGTLNVDTNIRIPSTSINMNASGSSNNILNSNLSGSFQRDGETTDDENILSTRRNRSTPILPTRDRASTSTEDRGRTSTSSTGRIGFAAIPNNNFNPSPPITRGRNNFM